MDRFSFIYGIFSFIDLNITICGVRFALLDLAIEKANSDNKAKMSGRCEMKNVSRVFGRKREAKRITRRKRKDGLMKCKWLNG